MAKRKTRKQKILADTRHLQYTLEPTPAQVSLPAEKKTKFELPDFSISKQKTTAEIPTSHITSDLKRTSIVTTSIIAAQLLLFIVLRNIS